jgi:ATP-dependent Lon protease
MSHNKLVLLVPQKNANQDIEDVTKTDLYKYGTLATISQILRLPGNLLKILVNGLEIVQINHFSSKDSLLFGKFTTINVQIPTAKDLKFQALKNLTLDLFENYMKINDELPSEIMETIKQAASPLRKFYLMVSNLETSFENKVMLLQQKNLNDMYTKFSEILKYETELLKYSQQIDNDINDKVQQVQKKYLIREQIRLLREELGESEEEYENLPEIEKLYDKIQEAKMPESAKTKALEVLDKLKRIPSISPDFAVERNYLDLMLSLPWNKFSEDNLDLKEVQRILDEDHYDLEKPKDRIVDFIALLNLTKNIKKQIICFVGPPGTGKTSLAKSIARALNRKFERIALGGIKDEAEIRGHRRTYVGALPGKIITAVKKAGTNNPLILLDEIDKLSYSYNGDPASALLEVLDPEQNSTFTDHYLEVEWDLSNVLFITTANVYYDIPLPLLDRMEIIEISSYLDFQKVEIAKSHIINKLLKDYGMEQAQISFTDEAILKIISNYTREAGVRELERQIATILRKVAREFVVDKLNINRTDNLNKKLKKFKKIITPEEVVKYLKVEKYKEKSDEIKDQIGVVNGLAWTSIGGEILPVEVTIMNGPEKLTLTGKLGDVMKESAIAGLSYIRSNANSFNIKPEYFKGKEIHIHIPEGAIPKDGPSAGITMAIGLLSVFTNTPVKGDVAMTGEITLRGNILPIGGLREKLLAAKKNKMKTVIIPKENEKDLTEIPDFVKNGLEIIPVTHIKEAIEIVLVKKTKTIVI